MTDFRRYDEKKDKDAVARIWREAGWIEKKEHEEAMTAVLETGRTLIAEVNGEAECMVNTCPGVLRHLEEDIPVSIVGGVTTSRIARKQGLASRLTARTLAEETADGLKVALLGIFDQGFYNQLGFGNGAYEHWYTFDPADLKIDVNPRIPERLTADDWEAMHSNRMARMQRHGACSIIAPQMTKAEIIWSENGFGLGYCDKETGEFTHHFWARTKAIEHGPYTVSWMAYRTKEQLFELLGLLKNLADQVNSIELCEPPGIQMQDTLDHPFRSRRITESSKHENTIFSAAYWQARILDLPGCLEQTHLDGRAARFNLVLTDPIERFLDDTSDWRGVAGEYVVKLGEESSAVPGRDEALPTLRASVNAFTRLWLGVRPARASLPGATTCLAHRSSWRGLTGRSACHHRRWIGTSRLVFSALCRFESATKS